MKRILTIGILGLTIFILMVISVNPAAGYSNEISETQKNLIITYPDEIMPQSTGGWYYKPNNYAELVSWYQNLEAAYPNYLEVFKANDLYDTGTVYGGYDLYYVRITNEALGLHKPEVLFLGSPHGDETVGTIGLYWFTDWLFRMAFTEETNTEFSKDYLQWIIDNREIYFEVSHNPYGFDHGPIRYDGHGWDLNREADYDGPGTPTGGIWGSVPGKTLRQFVDHHLIRIGCDFHGGVRMLLYPWADTHSNVVGVSPISGVSYSHAPPDFYFYDVEGLRVGDYMGDYGGNLYSGNIGPIRDLLYYTIKGVIAPWAYGADVETNPVEDPYVQDETFGNYPGAGILWMSPEMSVTKNPSETSFGNDTIPRYGAEVRRFVLHQTDLAQPYARWLPGTIEDDAEVEPGFSVPFYWNVNGSLVIDHTYIQWGTDSDPINNPEHFTSDYDEYEGEYYGGTGWDDAESGVTNGVTYNENIILNDPGDYYFVAKAQVDQVYANVLRPDIYGNDPYSRVIKERTNDEYYEVMQGSDGTEEIFGQTWWYSPIIHVKILGDPPSTPVIEGPTNVKVGIEYDYTFTSTDPEGGALYYWIIWGDGTTEDWIGPYTSGEPVTISKTWTERGVYEIMAQARGPGGESDWGTLEVTVPRNRLINTNFIIRLLERFPNILPFLQSFLGIN